MMQFVEIHSSSSSSSSSFFWFSVDKHVHLSFFAWSGTGSLVSACLGFQSHVDQARLSESGGWGIGQNSAVLQVSKEAFWFDWHSNLDVNAQTVLNASNRVAALPMLWGGRARNVLLACWKHIPSFSNCGLWTSVEPNRAKPSADRSERPQVDSDPDRQSSSFELISSVQCRFGLHLENETLAKP